MEYMNSDLRTTQALANMTHSVTYKELPANVIAKAKELILDSIACIIGGTRLVQGKKIIELFASMKGVPEVQIFGTHEKIPLLNAVYVNSYLATVLDFDDTYDGHPGSTIVPVALSIAELKNVSGKAFIESVVGGYEIGIRISNGIKPTPERTHKVRGINTWQIFCATAVADGAVKVPIVAALNVPPRNARRLIMSDLPQRQSRESFPPDLDPVSSSRALI